MAGGDFRVPRTGSRLYTQTIRCSTEGATVCALSNTDDEGRVVGACRGGSEPSDFGNVRGCSRLAHVHDPGPASGTLARDRRPIARAPGSVRRYEQPDPHAARRALKSVAVFGTRFGAAGAWCAIARLSSGVDGVAPWADALGRISPMSLQCGRAPTGSIRVRVQPARRSSLVGVGLQPGAAVALPPRQGGADPDSRRLGRAVPHGDRSGSDPRIRIRVRVTGRRYAPVFPVRSEPGTTPCAVVVLRRCREADGSPPLERRWCGRSRGATANRISASRRSSSCGPTFIGFRRSRPRRSGR